MIALHIKFQIAALCFIAIIIINYIRNRHLPLISMKIFSLMLAVSFCNLLFDMLTVFTIASPDLIPAWLNRLSHQLFIGSLDTMIVLLFLYIEALAVGGHFLHSRKIVLFLIPYLISMIVVVLGPLEYYKEGLNFYSFGPMAYTIYATMFLYMIFSVVVTRIHHKNIKQEKIMALYFAISGWIAVAIIQWFKPTLLISSIAGTAMILYIYLTFENPTYYIDEETGLFNKRAFHQMIPEMFGRGRLFSVTNIVIDEIPTLQKQIGHHGVYQLLAQIGDFAKQITGEEVYLSRGNTISVLLSASSRANEEILFQLTQRLQQPWEIKHTAALVLKAHIDVIECPSYASSLDQICDMMNYLTQKESMGITSGSCLRFIEHSHFQEEQRRSTLVAMIADAACHDGFEVFYQPIYDTVQNSFTSAEALVRLKDTTTIGFVSPEEFIPIAEQEGHIKDLGAIVFEKVCQFIKQNQPQQYGLSYIEVNISGVQGIDTNLPLQLAEIMRRNEVDPHWINLEVTETAAVESGTRLLRNMKLLKEKGCSFSMDDFGTGYSNLSQIAEVNYDLIKLDKSLIWPCFVDSAHKENARIILKNVMSMLLQLHVGIVAEGVETKEQTDFLTAYGVQHLQGYFFSRPIREADYLAFLQEHSC